MPLPRFAKSAAAIGHVEADERSDDGVTRRISLESVAGHVRLWALSLVAFRLSRGAKPILESPEDLDVDGATIPIALGPRDRRPMRIRYTSNPLPALSVEALAKDPSLGQSLRGKTVFLGVTSMSATRDRIRTPYGATLSGVQIHAQAFETMRRGAFLRDARDSSVLLFCALVTVAAGIVFAFTSGWPAYLLGAALIAAAQWLPFAFFARGLVFPYVSPLLTAWLSVSCAASFQHFLVRGRLRRAETDKTRYRQAIQFVTHEMRTPLTAIQGSSELMGRYNLTEDKRRQIAAMIHSESKRLAAMIQTFLDVERLSAGQMEMKREPVDLGAVLDACLDRVRPLAEKKNIAIHSHAAAETSLEGDAEMLGYAVYNLLTNAVKYSPPGTEVAASIERRNAQLLVSVADHGIGMDAKEVKRVFERFYRTKRAEESGETGTGIGLSLVEQIVELHGGNISVTSVPGQGSCFTMALPAPAGVSGAGGETGARHRL